MSELWWPTTADVAALLTARTVDSSGEEVGDFTSGTRPTATQVDALIAQSAALVSSITGGQDLPAGVSQEAIKSLVALRAAMSAELSYFPEQVGTDSSPFQFLQSMYRDEFERVTSAVDRTILDSTGLSAGMARHTFPAAAEALEF